LLKQDPDIRIKLSDICQHDFVTSQELIRDVHENTKENAKLPLIEIKEVEENDDDTDKDDENYKIPDIFKKFKPDVNCFKDNEGVVLNNQEGVKSDTKSQNSDETLMVKVLEKFARMERGRIKSTTMIQNKHKNYEEKINSLKNKIDDMKQVENR
jgi:hypothetical protein